MPGLTRSLLQKDTMPIDLNSPLAAELASFTQQAISEFGRTSAFENAEYIAESVLERALDTEQTPSIEDATQFVYDLIEPDPVVRFALFETMMRQA